MQTTRISVPSPTKWGIQADIAGRPVVWGKLIITSVTNDKITGTIDFRGTPIPIHGTWNEQSKHITFDSPYATFFGNLSIFDDAAIKIRHYIFNGRLTMKPPSLQAGENGTWIATTDLSLNEPPKYMGQLPPVGAFVTSNLLYQQSRK